MTASRMAAQRPSFDNSGTDPTLSGIDAKESAPDPVGRAS